MTQQRLKSGERCEAIRNALRQVFAEKGFDGATTRDLAKAAGVSEALLYRHFPSKKAMYEAMSEGCLGTQEERELHAAVELEPSAQTLVLIVHWIVAKIIRGSNDKAKAVDTLAVRSMLEDGDFMRALCKSKMPPVSAKIAECLAAARKRGETIPEAQPADIDGWLVHAVGLGIRLPLKPARPVLESQLSRDQIIERSVWFCLLGLGLKGEVVKKLYNPKALALLAAV
ncbi:MAG TPA: helix-turn-helix domain-containing protein [Elusimicrobiota bacterium]|nr:helix-turn-helix domain-containing protein [Elusimicrobiota bacterium]